MPRNARCYDVLIASPGDVQAERQIVVECIEDWNAINSRATGVILQPRRWEFDATPETGGRPQSFINRQIVDTSDLLIGIFWSRLGSPSGVTTSGTVEEIDRLVAAGKPVALYFSTLALPYEHNGEQLAALLAYKATIAKTALFFEFSSHENLRRLVSLHLGQRMHNLAGTPFEPPAKTRTETAALRIRVGKKGKSGDVPTVNVVVEIQNLSPTARIREYSCDVSVPAAAMTFAQTRYVIEIPSKESGRRMFRTTEATFANAPIFKGDTLQLATLELGIDQLKMKGTFLEGDYEGTLADRVIADAVVDGEALHVEKPVSELFAAK
jgi:hypothetical protein